METSIQLSLIAFEKFKEKDLKETLRNLNQIKNLKKNNEQTVLRIQHNILVCEFSQADSPAAKNKVIEQLDRLINEMKQDSKAKVEEDKSSKTKPKAKELEEEHDVSLLVMNLAQMHYLNKTPHQAYAVLMNHFVHSPAKSQNQFVRVKAYILMLDICLQTQGMLNAMKILKILMNIRASIESEQMLYLENYLKKEQAQKDQEKDKNDTYNHILQKDSKPQFCSLICGFVLNQHGETKLLINLKEYGLMTDLLKAMVLIQLEKYQLASLQLKQVKSSLKEKDDSLLSFQKTLPPEPASQTLFQFVQKQILNIYKYTKAHNAYRQNQFKKVIMYLSPSHEVKVSISNMPVHN